MNLNMISPETETEYLLLSITKNCEMLIEQTHKKAEETLEFKLSKSRETFHFNPPVEVKENWMTGLISSEGYISVFNITEENDKFELYTGALYDELSYTTLKDKVAEVLGLSDNSPGDLENEILGPDIIKNYRNLSIEKSQTVGYYLLLKRYSQSPFQDFEIYLRNLTVLNEDDIQLILKQYNSKFKTFRISPGVYTFKDLTMVLSRAFRTESQKVHLRPERIHDKSDSILIDSDDVSLITKLTLRPDITALRFDEKSFFKTILGFSPHWDYKNIASYDREYYCEKKKLEYN